MVVYTLYPQKTVEVKMACGAYFRHKDKGKNGRIVQMSIVMAVKQGNRIWFGADTQSTRGTDKFNQLSPNDFKVVKLDNGILLSMTGEVVSSQFILAHPEWFTVDEKKGLTKEHIVTKILPKLYEALENEELFEREERGTPPIMKCGIIIAYEDKLFEISRDLHVIRYEDYQATGSGANVIIYGLSKIDKSKDIKEQLLRLLKISAKYDANVSAPFILIDTQDLQYTIKED